MDKDGWEWNKDECGCTRAILGNGTAWRIGVPVISAAELGIDGRKMGGHIRTVTAPKPICVNRVPEIPFDQISMAEFLDEKSHPNGAHANNQWYIFKWVE